MVDLSRQENLDIMSEVMSDLELHLRACRGYKYTGTMVAFDGSEDDKICCEAQEFWDDLGMRPKIDSAVAEVEAQFNAGKLPWTWETVQSLITPFPKRGQLDEVLPGQEDEATEDVDGVPWEVERQGPEELPPGDEEQFDLADWHETDIPDAEAGHALHGDGVALNAEQADVVIEQSARIASLQEARRVLGNVGGPVGASLTNTVNRVMHMETKRFNQRNSTDPAVQQEMKALLDAEEAKIPRPTGIGRGY